MRQGKGEGSISEYEFWEELRLVKYKYIISESKSQFLDNEGGRIRK